MSGKERRNLFLRALFVALDDLGIWGAVILFPLVVIVMSIAARLLLGWIEHRPADTLLFVNVAVVNGSVAFP